MAKKVKQEDNIKKYSLTDDEKRAFKRIISTIGFFNTAIEGLQYNLDVNQAKVERRVNVPRQAPEGYSIQTKIDPETLQLFVATVKVPKKEEKLSN